MRSDREKSWAGEREGERGNIICIVPLIILFRTFIEITSLQPVLVLQNIYTYTPISLRSFYNASAWDKYGNLIQNDNISLVLDNSPKLGYLKNSKGVF